MVDLAVAGGVAFLAANVALLVVLEEVEATRVLGVDLAHHPLATLVVVDPVDVAVEVAVHLLTLEFAGLREEAPDVDASVLVEVHLLAEQQAPFAIELPEVVVDVGLVVAVEVYLDHEVAIAGSVLTDRATVGSRCRGGLGLLGEARRGSQGQEDGQGDARGHHRDSSRWGKKGGLEKTDYKTLNKEELEREEGYKIFMFHTAINEFKPRGLENMEGESVASLPNNFNYYAGGHVHYIFKREYGKGYLTFPGALFPNNFKELEEWKCGGLYLIEDNNLEYIPIKGEIRLLKNVVFTFNPEMVCKNEIIASTSVVGFIQGATSANLIPGTPNKSEASDKLAYADCDSDKHTTIIFDLGNQTEIIQEKPNCYRINVANCEVVEAAERFIIGMSAHSKGYVDDERF